jgi:hypothetical protein
MGTNVSIPGRPGQRPGRPAGRNVLFRRERRQKARREVTVAEDRTVVVYAASSPAELDQARALFRAFVTWHRQRHLADHDWLIFMRLDL